MAWDEGLTGEQRAAAMHFGAHGRLLAGPGTGKTLAITRRITYLVEERRVDPNSILALTFTRAAAYELRQRVESELGSGQVPHIYTLHSYALRELLRNSSLISTLPRPLRIADDWEERNIILEDIKSLLGLQRVDQARDLLNELSSDWQSLTAEEEDWNLRFPNPAFLGAWGEHREKYGYVLRSELVYQLKRAMEQHGQLSLEGPPLHLLVDEYQDLNRCDLAVVKIIGSRGAEIFAAGDDDQSIYGFRKAHPEGIRRFPEDYAGATEMGLNICKRCDANILTLGLFVARQDYNRIEKPIRPDEGRTGGEVSLLRFSDQGAEADGIAALCRYLIHRRNLAPEEILILIRTDRNGVFSSLFRSQLEAVGVPVSAAVTGASLLNEAEGRQVLAMLRLLGNREDHLAWRTLLRLRQNNLGPAAISALYKLTNSLGSGLFQAIEAVEKDASLLAAPHGGRVQAEVRAIQQILSEADVSGEGAEGEDSGSVVAAVERVQAGLNISPNIRPLVTQEIETIINESGAGTLSELVRATQVSTEEIEQEIEPGKVNILTMHKAKGLTAEAAIIAVAEDEYIPGRASGDAIGDERRLLYVSLTRAKHLLFMTYCNRRTGQQRHTGRTSGRSQRNLTRFLGGAPISPQDGPDCLAGLEA